MKHINIAKPFILLSCVSLVFSFTACGSTRAGVSLDQSAPSRKGPPPHAPAYGYRAKHTYHYYPQAQVYFDISRELYFYRIGEDWRVSATLPTALRVRLGDHVTIELDSDNPYYYFEHQKKMKHPPGKMKKKK